MLSSPESEDARSHHHNHPLFVHRKIEDDIEHFVENFKQKSSALDRRLSSDSGDSSGWTSSVFSATDTPSTDSPDRDGELLPLPEEDVHGRNGIIAESRRIAQWALRQSRYASTSRESCSCSYHPKVGEVMGDKKNSFKVLDVAELLQSHFVVLTGGKARNGAPILTFPDRQGAPDVTDEDYNKVVTYLCDLVPVPEAEAGFVVVIDRRQDGWGAVRTILLKISAFFPYHVQVVFLLQPKGFFQRAFADFRSKFVKEELEFKVVVCDSPEEMAEYIEASQLTKDLGGDLTFDPSEWTEHRSAVEKFSQNADSMSANFSKAIGRFQTLALPRAVHEVEAHIRCCQAERKELLDDVGSSCSHGNTLLSCIRGGSAASAGEGEAQTAMAGKVPVAVTVTTTTTTSNTAVPLVSLCHVVELEKLLAQLEETKTRFEEFWATHEQKMQQGLQLRQLEEEMNALQNSLGERIQHLEAKTGELGSSMTHVEALIADLENLEEESKKEVEAAERMRARSEDLGMEDQYAADNIRPKCVELQRVCQQYKDLLRRRRSLLTQSRNLYHTVDSANHWCSHGVDLLAGQPLDRCQTPQGAEESLAEIDGYLKTFRHLRLSDPPRQLKSSFGEALTPETRASVQQVLHRVEDVQAMCEKRKQSLRRMCRHSQPHPHPHPTSLPPSPSSPSSHHPSPYHPHPHPHQVDSPVHLRRKTSAAGALEKRSPIFVDKGIKRRTSDSQLTRPPLSIACHDSYATPTNPTTTTHNNSNNNHLHHHSHHHNSSSSSSGVSSKTSSIAASSDASSGDVGVGCLVDGSGGGGGGGVGSVSSISGSSRQRDSVSSASVSSLPDVDVLPAKRRHVMNELIETEKAYVSELQEILWGYCKEMENRALQQLIPEELIGQKYILFGNLEQIYKFHSETFLQELQECRDYPAKVGRCFVNRKEEFQMYSIYCQNKPKSEALRMRVGDLNPFFKECQRKLGHKLPLGAYLLKPVQRITKYQLLLKEMLRFTGEDRELEQQLQDALDTMLSVLQYLNASMHQVHIVGYQDNLLDLGRLLLHGGFSIWTEHKRERIKDLRFKPMQRHIFLYERGLLLCKRKDDANEEPVYTFKNKLKLSQVGLTEKLKGDKRKFELWSRGREEVYIIQAPTLQVKDVWVKEIKRVLMNQFDQIRSHHKMYVPMSQDESSVSSQMSSDSSDYSLDNWRTGGGGRGDTTTSSTSTPIPISQPPTSTSTTATAPSSILNNNHNSTLPMGLEMISPLTPPSSTPFPHAPSAHAGARAHGEREGREGGAEGESEEQWSSGELSSHEEEATHRQGALSTSSVQQPSYRQQFVSLGDYQAVDSSELGMGEGEVVEVLRVGAHGWWYARLPATGREGWVPSTFLHPLLLLPPPPAPHPHPPGLSHPPSSSSSSHPHHPPPPSSSQLPTSSSSPLHSSSDSLSTTGKRDMSLSHSSMGSPAYLSSPVSETTV